MNGSIRLANSIIADRRLEAASVRAAREARRSAPSTSALQRLIDLAVASVRPTTAPPRNARLERGNALGD